MGIKKGVSQFRKAYKIRTNVKQAEIIFQTLNHTIHQAAPLIEYVADAVQTRLSKVNLRFFMNLS